MEIIFDKTKKIILLGILFLMIVSIKTPVSAATFSTLPGKTKTISLQPSTISLDKNKISLNVGTTEKLTATITPSNAFNKSVTWTSSDTTVATVSEGKITAKKAGTATITAKISNGKVATCNVNVYEHNIGEAEMKILASVINAEQGDKSREGQIAVGYVIKNRMKGKLTSDKLLSVLTAKNQFSTVQKYKKYKTYTYTFKYKGTTYYTKPYTKQSLEVAEEVMQGIATNPIGSRKYFWGASYYEKNGAKHKNPITIGGNTFFDW